MRKILKLLSLTAAFTLAACSSMEPEDDFERYGNFLPKDFNLAKFSALNPDVAATQAIGEIKKLNNDWEALQKEKTLTAQQITALKTQDNNAFFDGDGKTIAEDFLKWTDAFMTAARTESRPSDTTAQGRWLRFNIYGQENVELAFLENYLQTKIDSTLILQTYVKYSVSIGRPYRECKTSELSNEVKNIDMEGVIKGGTEKRPTYNYSNLFFCDDNGVVRKATDFSNN